jgi:5'-nucleotidase
MTRRILLSNDDGMTATGIRVLAEALRPLGELWVVAPDRERSATSHAISLHKPLRIREVAAREFTVDGTPTDCVYLAMHQLMAGPPHIVVSGINHGPNLGNDVLYSGTVSAAMEGALFGYRAIAVSLCLPELREGRLTEPADFAAAAAFTARLAGVVMEQPLQPGVVLNVNVPLGAPERVSRWKLCRLGYTDWADAVTARVDPRRRPYFWIGGERSGHDDIADSDNNAVGDGLIAVTPIHYDITDYRSFGYSRGLRVPGFTSEEDGLGSSPLPHPVHPRLGRMPEPKGPPKN